MGTVDHLALEELDCLMRFRSAQQHGSEIREMGRCVSVITERTYLVGTGELRIRILSFSLVRHSYWVGDHLEPICWAQAVRKGEAGKGKLC